MSDVTFFFGGWEPIGRIVVVGTLGYVALVALLRVSDKRTLAQLNAFDFIVTVAIGASFGRVLTARSVALAEAVTAFALLVALQYLVSWLQVRVPAFARLVTATPTLLYFRGRFVREALLRERITEGELLAVARQQGLATLEEVDAIVLEANGKFTVLPENGASGTGDSGTLADVEMP